MVGFSRGKAASIVSELSGRDPETHKVDEDRIPAAYDKLEEALLQIVKKYHFENFLMIVKERGVKVACTLLAVITPIAIFTGAGLHYVFDACGIRF